MIGHHHRHSLVTIHLSSQLPQGYAPSRSGIGPKTCPRPGSPREKRARSARRRKGVHSWISPGRGFRFPGGRHLRTLQM